jgi:hypothetical protein
VAGTWKEVVPTAVVGAVADMDVTAVVDTCVEGVFEHAAADIKASPATRNISLRNINAFPCHCVALTSLYLTFGNNFEYEQNSLKRRRLPEAD